MHELKRLRTHTHNLTTSSPDLRWLRLDYSGIKLPRQIRIPHNQLCTSEAVKSTKQNNSPSLSAERSPCLTESRPLHWCGVFIYCLVDDNSWVVINWKTALWKQKYCHCHEGPTRWTDHHFTFCPVYQEKCVLFAHAKLTTIVERSTVGVAF